MGLMRAEAWIAVATGVLLVCAPWASAAGVAKKEEEEDDELAPRWPQPCRGCSFSRALRFDLLAAPSPQPEAFGPAPEPPALSNPANVDVNQAPVSEPSQPQAEVPGNAPPASVVPPPTAPQPSEPSSELSSPEPLPEPPASDQGGGSQNPVPEAEPHINGGAEPAPEAANGTLGDGSDGGADGQAMPLRNRLPSAKPNLIAEFLLAAIRGDLTRVRALVFDLGLDTEIKSDRGWTPLNLAALAGHVPIVRFLLQAGANMEAREVLGQTPLGSAAINGHTDVVHVLLSWSPAANITARDNDGAQPVHYASQFGFTSCVKALLDAGADPNARVSTNGWTPLHTAAAAGQIETIQFLISHGADTNLRDWQGQTPKGVIGTTMAVTRRKRRAIECLLDREVCPEVEEEGLSSPEQEDGG